MRHSRAKSPIAVSASLVLLDIVGRLALPAALFALAHGAGDMAIAASVVATAATSGRGFALGLATERALARGWQRAVDAALAQPPSALRGREQEEVVRLIEAVREAAVFEAQAVPQIISLGLSLIAIIVAVTIVLGPAWLLLGAISGVLLGGLVLGAQLRLRAASDRVWKKFRDVVRDASVLITASVLLRAHGREEAFSRELLSEVKTMAKAERTMSTWSAMLGLMPATVAVLAVATPFRAGIDWAMTGLPVESMVDVGILGGAALLTGLAFARAAELAMRTAPLRKTLQAFLTSADPLARSSGEKALNGSLADLTIAFDGVACVHDGAQHATPAAITHVWSSGRGLAVVGDNGAGKSTLALMLLGLMRPTSGQITVGGAPLSELAMAAYRARVAYLPQSPYVAPGASVAWHLRLLGGESLTEERMEAMLEKVGLLDILREHAERAAAPPCDVLVGELSGGERQRMHLARVLLNDGELVVLDEPEVALDERGRAMLRALLEELSQTKRVLVIAHDDDVVPTSFDRLRCERGGRAAEDLARSSAAD